MVPLFQLLRIAFKSSCDIPCIVNYSTLCICLLPQNKLTSWNLKTISPLMYVLVVFAYSPHKKQTTIGNWKGNKNHPLQWKNIKFLWIIWIYPPSVPVANLKVYKVFFRGFPTKNVISWWWRLHPGLGLPLRCQLWSHRGGRFMGWKWTVLGGWGEDGKQPGRNETRGGKNWRS